jgi:hypothetical protein
MDYGLCFQGEGSNEALSWSAEDRDQPAWVYS